MGTFVAKLKKCDYWVKLADHILNEDYSSIDLSDAIVYDPNNDMAHQWFKLQDFSVNPAFLQMLSDDFDVADLEDLTRAQYDDIEFIAFVQDGKYYMQKISKSSFLTKKWFAWNGQALDYETKENVIYINPTPNCIYDSSSDLLYFMDISKAYSIFGDLKQDYKEATDDEVQAFLNTDIVEAEGLDSSNVGIANRKRITSVLKTYNNYNENQRATLKSYIHDKLGDKLEFIEDSQKFRVASNSDLKLFLYGILRRYYNALFEQETLVATNCTVVSNLL